MPTPSLRSPASRSTIVVVGVALVAALSACTSSSKAATETTVLKASAPCNPASTAAVNATPVADAPHDLVIDSFDGTKIRIHWYPLSGTSGTRHPTVLIGPGWGSGGDTNTEAPGMAGMTSIRDLHDAGYNVLTWDPRGFGQSSGTIEIDSAATEGRDVQRIIDWIAARPGVQLDSPGDPRMGMVGASYGGGIQLVTAAIDCRVDAIVPSWAWHSLTSSLYKAKTVKSGWGTLLYAVAASRDLDPHIVSAYRAGIATGVLSADDAAWFADRGPGSLVEKINIPTLFVQGTVDTLFTLDEAIENYRILRSRGVPTAMIWYCAGHGVCLTNTGDREKVRDATLAWLSRYVKRDRTASTGARFTFFDQNGHAYRAGDYPLPAGTPISASGSGTLSLSSVGGSGPAHPAADNPDFLAKLVAPVTPAKAANAVNVTAVGRGTASVVVGPPTLRLTYRGRVETNTRPTRVFAQLVDAKTGLVVGNQITPIDVTLDGSEHTTTVALESIVFTLEPTQKLVLQIVATTVAYSRPQLGGSVDITARLTLPVAAGFPK